VFRARAVGALALPFGYLVGHVAGCAATHGLGHDHHDMGAMAAEHAALPALGQVALPLLVLSVGAAVVMGARGERWVLSTRWLAALLGGAFVVVELYEHVGYGESVPGALTDRVLWAGLAVQVVLAVGWGRLLRRAHDVGARFRPAVEPPPSLGELSLWRPHEETVRQAVPAGAVRGRGPPGRLAP
jgi:hypothetical protein